VGLRQMLGGHRQDRQQQPRIDPHGRAGGLRRTDGDQVLLQRRRELAVVQPVAGPKRTQLGLQIRPGHLPDERLQLPEHRVVARAVPELEIVGLQRHVQRRAAQLP
jgi:hypothetical protein